MATNSSSKRYIPVQNKYHRVVLLVDMDCFYCQVEEKLDPSLAGKPLAVVQYNAWRGGGIIAVNYAARAKGVTRHMRGDEAKEHCPDIQLVKVPNVREKADLGKYRDAGKEVANVLQSYSPVLERASVDEAYLDISRIVNKRYEEMDAGTFILKPNELNNTYAVGYDNIGDYITEIAVRLKNQLNEDASDDSYLLADDANDVNAVMSSDTRLLIGASIASEIRAAVKQITGYECSAGIAHNKILAKLACGINKPNKQTILPLSKIETFFETLPVSKIKGLGGKFGEEVCEKMSVRYLGQLAKFTEAELQRKFDDKNGSWLYNISRGIDLEAVITRFYTKSIGCCKKFPGRNSINGLNTLIHWLNELAGEIIERLEKDIIENNRRAKQLVVSYIQDINGEEVSSSRSVSLISYEKDMLVKSCLEVIKANTKQFLRVGGTSALNNPLKYLGISVGKFETIKNEQNNLQEMFANQLAKGREKILSNKEQENEIDEKRKGENDVVCNSEKVKRNDETEIMRSDTLAGVEAAEKEEKENNQKIINEWEDSNEYGTYKKINGNSLLEEDNQYKNKKFSVQHYSANSNNLGSKIEEPYTTSDTEQINPNTLSIDRVLSDVNIDKNNKYTKFNTLYTGTNNAETCPKSSFFINALKTQSSKIAGEKSLTSTDSSHRYKRFTFNQINKPKPVLNDDNAKPTEEDDIHKLESEILRIHSEEVMTNTLNIHSTENQSKELYIGSKRKHADLTDHAPSKNMDHLSTFDYKNEYAEYAVPKLRPELLQFTLCNVCNTRILADERSLREHQDHHLAQKLSKQQRLEFRQEISRKILAGKSSKPANKISKNSKPITNKADITKFLKQSQLNASNFEDNRSDCQAAAKNMDRKICPECKSEISSTEMDEHLDYHMAKNLHRKLNQLEVRTVPIAKKKPKANNQHKKLINSSILNLTNSGVTSKTIMQFFTQSNN